MKFLILQRAAPEAPVESLVRLTPEQFSYLDRLKEEGKVDLYYHMVGQQGQMIMCNAESDEELSRIVSQDPLFYYTKREIYPLTTPEVHKKHMREILAKR